VQANLSILSNLPSSIAPLLLFTNTAFPKLGVEDDADGDNEMFPAMADDNYSAQLSFQSQSKDNLKYANLFPPGVHFDFAGVLTKSLALICLECSWTISVLHSMIDSKLIDTMLCPNKLSGR